MGTGRSHARLLRNNWRLPLTATIIGIDCATDPANVGLARAVCEKDAATLLDAIAGTDYPPKRVADWINHSEGRVLLALDAPLGWPQPLATALMRHRAGEALRGNPDDLFSRATDRHVHEILEKRPLEVGADRIARTAHSAMRMLTEVRAKVGKPIPLAWRWDAAERISAIEVYPAATLLAYRIPTMGYKGAAGSKARSRIIAELSRFVTIERHRRELLTNAHALDALVCVLAGIDFLEGRALPPPDQELSLEEGWIWVRPKTDWPEGALRR